MPSRKKFSSFYVLGHLESPIYVLIVLRLRRVCLQMLRRVLGGTRRGVSMDYEGIRLLLFCPCQYLVLLFAEMLERGLNQYILLKGYIPGDGDLGTWTFVEVAVFFLFCAFFNANCA